MTNDSWFPCVTKSGVWLFVAQKPMKRPSWWRGCYHLVGEVEEGRSLSKGLLSPLTIRRQEFYRQVEGPTCRNQPSALTDILKLVIGDLISVILIL